MNQQPSEYVGQLCALAFCCMFLYYAVRSYKENKTINLNNIDCFTLGYVEESSPIVHVVDNTVNAFESQQLYVDCIDALHALGMKKSEAKKRAKLIFSMTNPQPSSVQEFLILALKF
jgi:hypothetical protein